MGRNKEAFQELARKITGNETLECTTKKDALNCITNALVNSSSTTAGMTVKLEFINS